MDRRRVPLVTHTHALFAGQSHSIPDNLVALFATVRAWNCSDPERLFANINGYTERAPSHVHYQRKADINSQSYRLRFAALWCSQSRINPKAPRACEGRGLTA